MAAKVSYKSVAVVVVALLMVSAPAGAASILYSTSYSGLAVPGSTAASLSQFDPSLGTLTKVTLELTGQNSGGYVVWDNESEIITTGPGHLLLPKRREAAGCGIDLTQDGHVASSLVHLSQDHRQPSIPRVLDGHQRTARLSEELGNGNGLIGCPGPHGCIVETSDKPLAGAISSSLTHNQRELTGRIEGDIAQIEGAGTGEAMLGRQERRSVKNLDVVGRLEEHRIVAARMIYDTHAVAEPADGQPLVHIDAPRRCRRWHKGLGPRVRGGVKVHVGLGHPLVRNPNDVRYRGIGRDLGIGRPFGVGPASSVRPWRVGVGHRSTDIPGQGIDRSTIDGIGCTPAVALEALLAAGAIVRVVTRALFSRRRNTSRGG